MKKAVAVSLSLVLLLLTPSLALAETKTSSNSGESTRPSIKSLFRAEVKEKISEVKEKTCEARMDNIEKRSEKLAERAVMMEENFGTIDGKVQTYYTEKLVPAGGVVTNYDALVADIATKKAAVDSAVSEAKSKASAFDCTDKEAAKTWVKEYRVAMQKVIAALNAYKTSIKNLIVAVRTAAGKVPKPSPSPES